MKGKSRMLLVLTLLVLLGGSLTISTSAYVTPPYSVAGSDSTGWPSSASANKNTGYLGADANAKGSSPSLTLKWAWGYVGETVVPSSDTHIKIGFTGTFHYDVNPLPLWPGGARAKVYVTVHCKLLKLVHQSAELPGNGTGGTLRGLSLCVPTSQ